MSETANGLQNSLDLLHTYCNEWGLKVNIQKTKSLVFNKTGRLEKDIFKINDIPIDRARPYKYLGIIFSINGNFTEAKKDLHSRALKAYFKLSKNFNELKPNIKTLFNIFDHTVKPILLYGSEVWGANMCKKLSKNKECIYFTECKNLKQESLHVKFCKFVLIKM